MRCAAAAASQVLAGLDLAAARGDLLGVGARQGHRGALRLDLAARASRASRLRRVERGPGLIELLRRGDALLGQVLGAVEVRRAFSRSAVAAATCASLEASVDSACAI